MKEYKSNSEQSFIHVKPGKPPLKIKSDNPSLWTSEQIADEINNLNNQRDEILEPVMHLLAPVENSIDVLSGLLRLKIADKKKIRHENIIFGDFWDCTKSPTKKCVYDRLDDVYHARCIYCHEPIERK